MGGPQCHSAQVKKFCSPPQDSIPGPSKPIASRYTDYAITAYHLRWLKFQNEIQCCLALYPYTRFPVCLVCNGTSTWTEPFIWVMWSLFSYLYFESNSAVLLGQKTSKNRWWYNLKYRRRLWLLSLKLYDTPGKNMALESQHIIFTHCTVQICSIKLSIYWNFSYCFIRFCPI